MIQKKIHAGVFAVMDGTFAGDGPGRALHDSYTKKCDPGVGGSGRH